MNEEIFVKFSSRSGSLDHVLVPGKSVSSPSQSELVKEAFSDPSFLKQLRGLEAMLRVRERAVAHSDAGRAARKFDSTDSLFGHLVLVAIKLLLVLLLVPVLTLWPPARPASARVLRPTSTTLKWVLGQTDSERVLVFVEPEAGVSEEISRACLENSRIHKSRSGCLDSPLSVPVSSHARARIL